MGIVVLKVKVYKTIGEYVVLEIPVELANNILNLLRSNLNKGEEDVDDAMRMITHFDIFYNLMKKKFKEYLTPRKSVDSILKRKVLIDKIKLVKKNGMKFVEIILDRSISLNSILDVFTRSGIEVERD